MIETVKTQGNSYLVNGTMFVPNDPANSDYQAILDWINEGNLPEGPDVVEPDYIALRTGPEGYASTGDQLGMQYDGTWEDHVKEVKEKFPKTITGGVTIGEVPQELLDAAAEKLFNQQLADYVVAVDRLSQYELSKGREEITEMQPTGEQVFNEETGEMEDVMMEVIIQTAIEPLEATVEQIVNSADPEAEPTVEIVPNTLIVQDEAERAEAQAVVDATPDEVKQEA